MQRHADHRRLILPVGRNGGQAKGPDRSLAPNPSRLKREAEASPERIVFRDDHDLVAVDLIGGDSAIGSIPGLEDDDRNHERGGEGGGEGVCIFAGHLFGSCLGGGGPSPARQDPAGPKTG